MASVGSEEGDGAAVPLDIDNVHMLLQVEQEQIQRRTFTNWINAQLSKRRPPSFVSDLFSDLRDGSRLLDLLEVMSGQTLKRQRGHGFFQQRANIESALDFLRKKNIKLVNINVPDIVDGRPSIVLGLVWTIILHCHIEELANALSFSSRHSSLDSLASLDSWSGSPVPVSPVPAGRTSPLHRRFRVSAKKALLMWVRDQCQKVGSSVSVKDFRSSWRSGEAFLAVLCSLRPRLVDLSLVQSRSNRENLEEAFHLAERELHIPRLLEPQDVDVKDPDDKSIMTYVAQFLQYSNDMPAPDDHLQISASERAQEVTCWLQQTCQELSEARTATGNSEKHQLQRCKADPDLGLPPPPPLDSVVAWLRRAEAALTEEGGRRGTDPADRAREARAQQDALQTLMKEMSHHVKVLDDCHNVDGSGNALVPPEKFDEIKRRVTHVRVTTMHRGIKLEYQERRHAVRDLLNRVRANVQTWAPSYRSKEAVLVLLQDWHETVERQDLLLILTDALQHLKEKADAYTDQAALGDDSLLVRRRLKEAEGEAEALARAVAAARGSMERVASAWDTYDGCLASLQGWLARSPAVGTQDMSEWAECQAKLNEAGNFLIEVTDTSTGRALAGQLGKVNKHWAECVKRTTFEVPGSPGLKERAGEPVRQTQTRPETGSFVVARARRAEQTGTATLQTQGPGQLSPRTRDPQGRPQHRHTDAQGGATIVVPLVTIQMLPRPLTEAVLRFHSPLESKPVIQPQSFSESHAQALRQKDQPSPSSAQTDAGPRSPKSLVPSKHVTSSVAEEKESLPLSQTHKPESSTRAQPINAPQTDETSPRPPIMIRGEVHSRARSMARSRLDKARVRLQGRIQQAMELFGGKEISESQAKRKQRALKTLQPVVLEEFLDAAEGFGAFCSGPRLRELTLLSDSVRRRWQDVCREMAAFVPSLWSQIGEGKQSFSVVQTETNAHRHGATDPTDHDCVRQRQDVVDGAASAEERVESLRELCETVTTTSQSSCPATERPEESDEERGTRPGDTVLPQHGGRQLGVNAPLGAAGASSPSLPERRRADAPRRDPSPARRSVPLPGDDSLPLRSARDVPSEGKDSAQNRNPAPRAGEQLLTARLLRMAESNEPTQTHIQAVVRSSTVESKQAAEWTVVPDAVDEQEEQRSGQEVLERCRTSCLVFQPQLEKIDQHSAMKDEMKPTGTEQTQRSEEFAPVEKCPTRTRDDSGTQEREHRPPRGAEEEEEEESGLDGEHKSQTWEPEGDVEDQRRGRRSRVKEEGEEEESSVQRRDALFGALREMREAAERLRLHELTLPALQQRTRALTELQSRHAGLLPELRRARDDASPPGHRGGEVEGSWEETTKALNERLEQCCVLTELLKRFQSVRAELSGTLQKAESTIGEQASYMGKENLLRLHSKVQETKAELRGLGDGVEEVRGVCRQIHTHLRQMPECDVVPFESDADTLMDSWLDISERTDSRLENSHLCLTLWDGVLRLGAEVEKWSADKLAAFAQSPRFQSEDDVRALQSEIVAQEENVEHFQRRATEIQTLLRSTERPLELQVAETQMRKRLEQLKELVSEAEDVYEQTVAAKGQIAARVADCFESLRRVHDSLLALEGSDGATVLAKLKDLWRQLQAQDERAEGLLDDLRALSSVCGADALQSLSEEATRLRDEVGNSRRLLSEVRELTQRDVRDLHRAKTELLGEPVSSPQSGDLRRSALLPGPYRDLHADEERRRSAGGDAAAESWVGDPRRLVVDAPPGGSPGSQSPEELRLHRARAAVSAAADGEARLEKRRVAGNGLTRGLCDGDDLKRDIQDSVQKTEEQRRILLQSAEPRRSVLQSDADIRVGELQRQVTRLPASFPWPGAAERRQAGRLARRLWAESESLQITLRRDLAERTSDHDVLKDSSRAELDNCCSSLMAELKDACSRLEDGASDEEHFGRLLQDCHRKLTSLQDRTSACRAQSDGSAGPLTDVPALEALLREVTDLEKDILLLETLKDSIADSSTVEAQASLSQQVGNLQSHKRALDGSIRGNLAPLAAHGNRRRVQQVKEEVSCVRTAVRGLADDVGNLFAEREASADASSIKQQWSAIQDFDSRLTDLAARVRGLQKTAESGTTPEMLPADVLLTVDGVAKDFDSLRSFFLRNKQECAENTACGVRGVIGQLQRWSQATVQAEPSQAALDEGSQLQQYLREVLSDKDLLLNCLGTKVSKELEKNASDALGESACALEASSKWPVTRGHGDVELDKKETAGETFSSDTSHSASPDETPAMCPPESPSPSATDQEHLDSVQNDNKIITKGSCYAPDKHHPSTELVTDTNVEAGGADTCASSEREDISVVRVPNSLMQTAKEDASVSNQVPNPKSPDVLKSETKQEPRQLTSAPPEIDSVTDVHPKDDIANINADGSHQNTGHRTTSGNTSTLDSSPSALTVDSTRRNSSSPTEITSGYSTAQSNTSQGVADAQEVKKRCENIGATPKKVFTIVLDMEPHHMQDSEHVRSSDTPLSSQGAELCDAKLTEVDSQNVEAQSETFDDGQEKEQDTNASPNKVFTIVLDVELPVCQDVQRRESVEASRCSQGAELCDAKPTGVSKSDLLSTLIAPDHADRVIAISSSALMSTELELSETRDLMPNVPLNSPKSCGGVAAERQLTGAHAAETTFLSVEEELTDPCHSDERTVSSVLCTAESPVRTGDAFDNSDTRIPAGDDDDKHTMGADDAAGERRAELAAGENAEGSEGLESKHSEGPERQDDNTSLPKDGSESESLASLEDTEVTRGQPQMREGMEPERTAPGSPADPGPAEGTTMTMATSHEQGSTMQDVFSEIQSLVERSNIINRTPHIDLNWYLKSSPGEQEIRLVRTVQRVLACRYQPAQLDVTAMAQQLEEAEGHRSCVQEQVATMKSASAGKGCDPNALPRAEGQWRAALLDASATVQVKAAQLDQVKQFHKQVKLTRAFLEVLAAEREKMSLNALGSSAAQADKLQALLQTMEQKKSIMEELLHLSSQMSVHLSYAESSGALLAQLGDVQEQWRLLEASMKRALRHATNSTSQSSVLVKEAEQLRAKLEDLQSSNFDNNDGKSDLDFVCLTTDLKLYHQLYLHLQSQSEALVHFSLGQKEKDEVRDRLQELGSLLDVTKAKLHDSACGCGDASSAKINKQLKDLIVWAKQAENHISTGKKLALFPEEARVQITDMKKFQTGILSRRSKMRAQVEGMKGVASDMEKEESDQVLKTIEDLYEAIADSLDHVLDTMKKHLQKREKLLSQLASMDAWLAQSHATRDACAHVENVSKADVQKLESELRSHKLATVEIRSQLKLVEAMAEGCKDIAVGLSPGESRYLVNRLSGLWTELDGLLAHENATSWELEELIHERTSSDEELSVIQTSLEKISADLDQQRFPSTQETLSTVARLTHVLVENRCQAQELQHCNEAKRSALLHGIGELQDRCKALSLGAFEQDKYLHLRRQMEESRDVAKEQMRRAREKSVSVGERFRLCQALLVELPLVKTQCQEAGDQLEALAQELYPSQLHAERQRIRHAVETLVSLEQSVADDVEDLEAKLLLGLRFSSELPALTELFRRARAELEGAEPVDPDERAIDGALRRRWVAWRNMESGMRVLEALGRKQKANLKDCEELHALRDAAMQECHLGMESLSQARESLKDYQWAAQGAIAFLHNADATFLSAPGGFLDCAEEQRQTRQALEALEEGFQAHIRHLAELLPQQPCLSRGKVEELHIGVLSQLLVGRAVLEAQAQLRLESLQRCAVRQQSHRSCHEDVQKRLSGFEARLSECATVQVTAYDKCVAQQERARLLMDDLCSLAGQIEELRAACPMQGCGVGRDGELGTLWRRWVALRRGVGLLMAHAEQRREEWKDITTSMQQCCSFLASLQAEVPDSSTVSFTQEIPQELLAQAEIHQAGLEQEQQDLASLEHRLEHALSLSHSLDPVSPGPVGKTLVKIQENVRSLKERNLMIVAAAQAEEKEREQVLEEIDEVEKHVFALVPKLEACWNPSQGQELRKALSSHKAKLENVVDGVQSRYAEVPADIGKRLQEVQRRVEELVDGSDPVRKLAGRVVELGSGLGKVTALLEQKSPTVGEAQNVLKRVWDELDTWHSRLTLLESETQDLAEEQPDQAHVLMDHIARPLQLHQNASQMAEYRTAFLSKIPACLRQFEDISYSATCWLDEAQSWLSAPCSFTTARSLQNHANSLQLVLDDSERIRDMLQDFRPVLAEISAVCDVGSQEETLDQSDQRVHQMQRNLLEPLEQLLQAAVAVEAMEAEVKTMEKNVPKIRTILSSMDDSNITLTEHLHNREVILANVQSIRTTLEEMERCKAELLLPRGAEESLLVFSRARLLLQPLGELGKLTQYQTSLLQNKIAMEAETRKHLGLTAASDGPEERQQQVQEPCEVSNSEEEEEEEEEEDDESCHSSSSDTLTCSVPEDPEEMLVTSDVESEDVADVKPLPKVKEQKSSTHQFSPEVETSSKRSESSDSDDFASKSAETGLTAMDSKADVAFDSSRPETLTSERLLIAEVPPAAGDTLDRRESAPDPRTNPPQAAAAVEETRLVPVRPVAPFTSTRDSLEFVREDDDDDDGDLASSTAPHPDVETLSKEQCEAGTGHDAVDESQRARESSKGSSSLSGHEGDETEQQRWSRLYGRISEKLTALRRVEEQHRTPTRSEDGGDHEEVPEKQLISTGSAAVVLQRTRESAALLGRIVKSADASHPDARGEEGEEEGEGEGLYEALRSVLLCLDAWTDGPDAAGEDEPQLRLLQQECVSAELATVAELLNKVQPESEEDPDARQCLTRLRDCLRTVQPLFTSSHNQLAERLGLQHQHQFHNQLSLLDEFDLGQCETFPGLKDAPNLERCVLGRHLRESPGEEAELRRASRASLQGITHLLELAEGGIKERQASQVHGRGQLQAALCRHQKLLRVLGSQLAFAQHLFFRREPETPERLEDDERLQRLEVRARALQQEALGREAASQRRLQEWTLWEDRCCQLGRVLDESEALISSGEAQGEDDGDEEEEELVVRRRLEACQRTLARLDESRGALGLMLDQRESLRTEPALAASVGQAGGALELRWRSARRRTEQEVQRCRDVQAVRARFQTHFSSVSNWLLGADERLKSWSDENRERDPGGLVELLDFSMATEAMSARRASVSRDATRLLHLWEADRPGLRAQVAQLEVNWSRHTSGLSSTQEQLHQRLLARWPPAELLSDLEAWLKKQEASLSREEEALLGAKDAAQIAEVLQRCRELKAGVVSGQLLVDFLCQSRPPAAGADVLTLQSERTAFAEALGDLRLRWLHLQGTLESQIRGAEQTRHTCAARERRLQHLGGWIARQKEQLSRWERPASQTLAREALREWEDVVGRGKEVAAALQRLKAAKEEEEGPRDVAFSSRAESVSLACEDLSQQMEALRPTLRHTVEQWSRFQGDLREVSLRAGELRCALQRRRAPLFSLGQAEGHVELLRELQVKAEEGEELWAAVEKSSQSLVKTLHCGAARAMGDQVDGEQRRWKDATRELKDELLKAAETASLWREHRRLSEDAALGLRRLWLRWEELPRSRDRDARAAVQSVETLQGVAENLQSGVSDALEASERLAGRLVPPAANLIQSEVGLLSRDVLLLSRAMTAKRKSLQEDLEDQKLFHICLQSLETQTQNIKEKLKEGSEERDSEKVLLELADLFPPLVDVRETSSYLTLGDRDAERLRALGGEWVQGVTRASDLSRQLQAERQRHQTVQEKCDHLTRLKEKLVEGSRKHESPSCLQEILTVQQRLQADVVAGHQLLQGLLCDAVESVGKESGERRSELVARVSSAREGWLGAVALAARCRSAAKEQLRQRGIYSRGLRVLWRLLRDVDPLLPPAGPALCALPRSRSCADDYQCVEEALELHSAVYDRTLEAGRRLCEAAGGSEGRSRLQSELRAVAEAWEGTASRLERRTDLLRATAQKWSRCQEGLTSLASDLDEVKTRMLERPEDSEKLTQETELSLQRLAGGLRELGAMKTDLSQHITAGDSALLEQQLEQLHGQWEELCMKVSLRKQEIADRLNAWTIFNDKNKEFCDWLAQMENKVGHSNDLSVEEMVEKLKKDCMEEINLFSENKRHLKQLGEQLLLASDEAKQTRVRGSLQEVNQRWHNLFHHIEARVKKLKETLVTLQQLDKNMSNLRSWLSRIEAELSRPITYSVCHHQEIQRRLAEQQELQRDIEQHTEGVASVLSLCDVLLRDEDAAGTTGTTGTGGDTEAESDSLQETSRSLDQRWRTICALALDRRLRIEETWRLWCKFLDDYSRFEDWLKSAERTAANPNSAGVLYTAAKEELKKFEGFQRQVHERLTQLEIVNNQYRRLARENRTDRASQLKAMVHEGNRRWDVLHRRVAAILRRLKYFTSQREEFEGTRENMLVWLTELDLQLTNVEHFSESDVHHKIQQLNSFQKEITLNTERIDGLIVFGEGLIQRSSPQDAALIEDELEELHAYCQEVFSRLVRFHQRLSAPPKIREEPELSGSTFSLESSLELIGRPWLGRGNFSLPATPTHLLASPLERSGRETPVSVDSLPLEWDHTGDVGGSSSHEDEDDEEEEEQEEEGVYFSALSVPSRSVVAGESPVWDADTSPLLLRPDDRAEAEPTLTSTPRKKSFLGLMSQCSGSIEDIKRVSLILDDDDDEQQQLGLTGLTTSEQQSGVIERWELLQARSRGPPQDGPRGPERLRSELDDLGSWLEDVIPELERLQRSNPGASVADMEARARELKEMQRMFAHHKSTMLSVNLRAPDAPELQRRLTGANRDWSRVCAGLQRWDAGLRKTLLRCREFHETLHSLLLWLAHAESRRYAVDIGHRDTPLRALRQHRDTLAGLREELRGRQAQQASLQALWSQLRPEGSGGGGGDGGGEGEESDEAQEKLHVTGNKLKRLLRDVDQDLSGLRQRLTGESAADQCVSADCSQDDAQKGSSVPREKRESSSSSPPRSFFHRVLRAAFPLHLLLLLVLLLPCLIPLSDGDPGCSVANNFASSFYPMLHYTNGPPPT